MISKVKPVVSEDESEWYETWFNSPYYHILYANRDEKEAELFLDNLIRYINPSPDAYILDVACGKGRHSIYLNKKGFDVTGFDLSSESILYDKQFENDKLNFYLHDMREVFRSNYFDIVLNLFSSFGYFNKERDNIRCFIANSIALKPKGIFVFDYFNVKKVTLTGNKNYDMTVEGIDFKIEKVLDGKFIRKKISFEDKGKKYHFEEMVLLATREILEKYFEEAGLIIKACFGNYMLEDFKPESSDRLILIAEKK